MPRQWGEGLGGLPGLTFQGTWDATANDPPLASGVGNKGDYYVVGTGGATDLDGIVDWVPGDWATFNGTVWQKVDNTEPVVANLWTKVASLLHPTTVTDNFGFLASAAAPEIFHQTDEVATAGDTLTSHAQDLTTAAGAKTAGDYFTRGGDCADGDVSNTGGGWDARPGAGATANGVLTLSDGGGTPRVTISAAGSTTIDSQSTMFFKTLTATRMEILNAVIQFSVPTFQFANSVLNPVFQQLSDGTNGATGDTLLAHSQDMPGTTSIGADFHLRPGAGTSVNGELVLQDGGGTPRVTVAANGSVAIGASATVDQSDASAAVPALIIDQADVSEEMIEFISTIGVGNAIEAIGAKSLTTTHFIKVTLPGGLTRYISAGTIA